MPALCLLTCVSCQLDTAPVGPTTLQRQGSSEDGLGATDGIIGPAPTHDPPADGDGGDGGGDANAVGVGAGSSGNRGSGGVAGHAGSSGSPPATSGGIGGGAGRILAGTTGSSGVGANTGGAGSSGNNGDGAAGKATAGSEAGGNPGAGGMGGGPMPPPPAGRAAVAGRGPQAGTSPGDGGGTVATFNELIDQLSGALDADQRNRIIQALTTNSVTPQQLNELLDAVKNAGACEGGHDACQQMCMLVLGACPSCMKDAMTANAELQMCSAL
jgi:hypothetical protein